MLHQPAARSALARCALFLAVIAVTLGAPVVLVADEDTSAPRAVVSAVIDAVRAALADATLDDTRRREAVDRALLRHVDFAALAKQALGKRWGQASPEQRAELVTLLRERALSAWWGYVKDGAGANVTIDEETKGSAQRVTVTSRVTHGKRRVALDWKLYRRDDQWLIYDLTVGRDGWQRRERAALQARAKAGGIGGLVRELRAEGGHTPRRETPVTSIRR